MKTRQLRKLLVSLFIVLCIAVCLLGGYFLGQYYFGSKNHKTLVKANNKDFGTYQVVDNEHLESVVFKFEDSNLQAEFEQLKNKMTNDLTEGHLTFDCESKTYYNKTLLQLKCKLFNEHDVLKADKIIYNLKTQKKLSFEDIFRSNPHLYTKANLDFTNVDKSKLELFDQYLMVDQVKVSYEHEFLFKSGNGIPSLFKQDTLKRHHFNIDPNKKMIAFTYDDGPLNHNHDRIRELFNEYNIPATFYTIGNLVERYPEKILKTYQDGHTIANHTYSHFGLPNKNLTNIPQELGIAEYMKTDDAIFKIIGVDPTTTRPPGGFVDKKVNTYTPEKQVLWTVDSEDWKNKHNAEQVYQNVRKDVEENSIVLFHDLYDSSYEASKRLIPELLAEGYQFVDIDTLLDKIGE